LVLEIGSRSLLFTFSSNPFLRLENAKEFSQEQQMLRASVFKKLDFDKTSDILKLLFSRYPWIKVTHNLNQQIQN